MRLTRILTLTALGLALAPCAAPAAPGIYSRVLAAYQANGSVPPCQFTSAQLQQALKGVDTYGQQYFADFTNAVQLALDERASGACLPGGPPQRSRATAASSSRFIPPSITSSTGSDLPAVVLVLAALTAALALAATATAVGRARGWDPRWARWLRHCSAEASERAAGAWWAMSDRMRRPRARGR